VKENVYFKNLLETQRRDAQMNHTSAVITSAPNTSAYLYWITGQAGITPDKKSVGPAIALNVSPGDQLDLSAWARFKIKTTYTKAPIKSIVAGALASNFAFTNGLETLTQATSTFNAGLLGLVSTTEAETNRPYAYLNYLVFNSSNVVVEGKALRVPLSAGFEEAQRGSGYTQNNLVKFDTPITINQAGYIYVWVSNESENTEVWFDDVSIMHHKPLVAQATDYGAWGEVLREQKWLDLDAKYRYGYQGKYAEKDEETGWNHFELREYDPVIGRWTAKDPEGQYYSPYVAMGNDPVNKTDPRGSLVDPTPAQKQQIISAFSLALIQYIKNTAIHDSKVRFPSADEDRNGITRGLIDNVRILIPMMSKESKMESYHGKVTFEVNGVKVTAIYNFNNSYLEGFNDITNIRIRKGANWQGDSGTSIQFLGQSVNDGKDRGARMVGFLLFDDKNFELFNNEMHGAVNGQFLELIKNDKRKSSVGKWFDFLKGKVRNAFKIDKVK
jgi:RHS repeat-associated protein